MFRLLVWIWFDGILNHAFARSRADIKSCDCRFVINFFFSLSSLFSSSHQHRHLKAFTVPTKTSNEYSVSCVNPLSNYHIDLLLTTTPDKFSLLVRPIECATSDRMRNETKQKFIYRHFTLVFHLMFSYFASLCLSMRQWNLSRLFPSLTRHNFFKTRLRLLFTFVVLCDLARSPNSYQSKVFTSLKCLTNSNRSRW